MIYINEKLNSGLIRLNLVIHHNCTNTTCSVFEVTKQHCKQSKPSNVAYSFSIQKKKKSLKMQMGEVTFLYFIVIPMVSKMGCKILLNCAYTILIQLTKSGRKAKANIL